MADVDQVMSFEEAELAGVRLPPSPLRLWWPKDASIWDDTNMVLNQDIRIFIWSILDKIRKAHDARYCVPINPRTVIFLAGGEIFLEPARIPFTEDEANANYAELALFIEEEIIPHYDIDFLPYSLKNLMGILTNNPRGKVDLLDGHYGILTSKERARFIINIRARRGNMLLGTKYPNWPAALKDSELLEFLFSLWSGGKRVDPDSGEHLFLFHEFCAQRLLDDTFHEAGFNRFIEYDVFDLLENCYPDMMTELQYRMYRGRYLNILGLYFSRLVYSSYNYVACVFSAEIISLGDSLGEAHEVANIGYLADRYCWLILV